MKKNNQRIKTIIKKKKSLNNQKIKKDLNKMKNLTKKMMEIIKNNS
jgi:hypothetical protein